MSRPNVHLQLKQTRQNHPLYEYKIVRLRETSLYEFDANYSEEVVSYWKSGVIPAASFSQECECLVVMILDSRYRIRGHQLVSIGTLDTLICHPREVFRTAIVLSAFAVVIAHNHPSGDPSPSEDDIQATADLVKAGVCVGIHVFDHVIVGSRNHYSFRDNKTL